jgi:hypothetical protein
LQHDALSPLEQMGGREGGGQSYWNGVFNRDDRGPQGHHAAAAMLRLQHGRDEVFRMTGPSEQKLYPADFLMALVREALLDAIETHGDNAKAIAWDVNAYVRKYLFIAENEVPQ